MFVHGIFAAVKWQAIASAVAYGCTKYISQHFVLVSIICLPHYNLYPPWRYIAVIGMRSSSSSQKYYQLLKNLVMSADLLWFKEMFCVYIWLCTNVSAVFAVWHSASWHISWIFCFIHSMLSQYQLLFIAVMVVYWYSVAPMTQGIYIFYRLSSNWYCTLHVVLCGCLDNTYQYIHA